MANSALEKPRTANVTVKLEDADRERLKRIATARNRTPHYILREALHRYLEEEEAQQRFVEAAQASLDQYRATGQHVTLQEFGAWATALKTDPKAPMPAWHK
jgi:predicted transcriptional regulator